MRNRRFALLAVVLVTLNVFFWLAPAGLAVRQMVVAQLFGPKLMRADVFEKTGAEWRVDRGVITAVTPTQITLTEADTRVQQIAIARSTRVIGGSRRTLSPGWQVLVTWPANGAADTIQIERRVRLRG